MKNFKFEIQSDFRYLPFLTAIFKALNVPKYQNLTQILVEAFTNAVVHGNKKNKKEWIGIELSLYKDKTEIRVIDRGSGIKKPAKKKKYSEWQTHGRGLLLIRANADRMKHKKQGKLHIFEAMRLI